MSLEYGAIPAWYVARTRPRAEYRARDHLEAAGIEAFLPAAPASMPRPGREDAPLFPGYLFVRCELEAWRSAAIRRVPEVAGLVTFDGEPPTVPDRVMQELREQFDAFNEAGGLWPELRPGDQVWVPMGSGESLAEVVTGARSPEQRVQLLLEFLGGRRAVEVLAGDVWAVKEDRFARRRPPRRTRGHGRWIKGAKR